MSATPLFRRAVVALADVPKTAAQVVALAVGLGAVLSYFYWGLGLALAPLIAIHFCAAAERKRIRSISRFSWRRCRRRARCGSSACRPARRC